MREFAYLDTLVLSALADESHLWPAVSTLLESRGLSLALSRCHIAELHEVARRHASICEFLATVPTCLVADAEAMLQAEIASYPDRAPAEAIVLCALTPEFCKTELLRGLRSPELRDVRVAMRQNAELMQTVLDERRDNFPPGPTGRYTSDQADLFADHVVIEKLLKRSREALALLPKTGEIPGDAFLSLRLAPLVSFFKYYVGRRAPKTPSDLGDLCHLEYMPYCRLVVTERDLQETLRQLRPLTRVLDASTIKNISFLRELGRQVAE